jgi:hypothetical protein
MFNFADNLTVESLDSVPEDYRCFYAEDGSGFKLDNENPVVAASVKNLTQLGTTLSKERENLAQARKGKIDISPLNDWGTNPTEIAEKFTELLTEAGKKGSTDTVKWQEKLNQQKADMAKAHSEALAAQESSAKTLKEALYSEMVSAKAVAALAKHKGSPDLLMNVIRSHVQVSEDESGYRAMVVDQNGTERFGGTGAPMAIDELVAELKKDDRYARAFDSEVPKGTGTTPGGPSRPAGPSKDGEQSPVEKIKAGLAGR